MGRLIVFDSSTLILLAKISLLRCVAQEMRVTITDIVKNEAIRKDIYDAKIIKELIKEEMIEVVNAGSNDFSKIKGDFGIENGEASSLALAIKSKCMFAVDDWQTMKACIILGSDFTTAVHFVVRLCKRGLLDKKAAMEKLSGLEKHGWYEPRIIEDAKQRIEGD